MFHTLKHGLAGFYRTFYLCSNTNAAKTIISEFVFGKKLNLFTNLYFEIIDFFCLCALQCVTMIVTKKIYTLIVIDKLQLHAFLSKYTTFDNQ